MFHNLITRSVEFANCQPSWQPSWQLCQKRRESRNWRGKEIGLKYSFARSSSLSLFLSFFSLTIKVSFYPRYTTYDYLRDRSPQTRNFVLKFLKSGKPPQLIDSAVYSDCRILEDIVSRKYPPKTSFAIKECSLFYLLFIFPLYSCVKYNLSDDCKLMIHIHIYLIFFLNYFANNAEFYKFEEHLQILLICKIFVYRINLKFCNVDYENCILFHIE